MFSRSVLVATLVAGAGLPAALAQTTPSVSTACQNAFTGIAANPDAANCLNAGGLISIFATALTKTNDSLVDPITSWTQTMCSSSPCSNDTLAAVVQNVTTGCADELKSVGLQTSSDSTSSIVGMVQLGYPTVRKVLCLKDNDAGKLCINEDLSAIETALGAPLSVNTIMTKLTTGLTSTLAALPNSTICSSCNKAAYTVIKTDFSSLVSSEVDSTVKAQCGADFVNGETPSNIVQTAASASSSSSSSGKNGAVGLASSGIMGAVVASVIAVGTSFAIFA